MILKVEVDYGGTWTRIKGLDQDYQTVRFTRLPSKPLTRLKYNLNRTFRYWKLKNLPTLTVGAKSIWTQQEKLWLTRELKPLAEKVTVRSDVEMSYLKSFSDQPGILLIAGTGSIALGKNSKGKMARAGGLGPKRGDEGSGFWIGKMYSQKAKKSVRYYAKLAPQAIQKAQKGDLDSKKIISDAQNHLLKLVLTVRSKLGNKNLRLKLAGGIFENLYFRKKFLRLLRSTNASL